MNWKRLNLKKNFLPIVAGALVILAVGTLYKSYKGYAPEPEVEKEKLD